MLRTFLCNRPKGCSIGCSCGASKHADRPILEQSETASGLQGAIGIEA